MSCGCEPGCACLGLSTLDSKLLRWRKELYEELTRLGGEDKDKVQATLLHELRALHRLLLQNVLHELSHEDISPDSCAAAIEGLSGLLGRTQSPTPPVEQYVPF